MVKSGQTIRIDNELAELIRETAKKNEMNIREASKEIARVIKPKIIDKKIIKEIKF